MSYFSNSSWVSTISFDPCFTSKRSITHSPKLTNIDNFFSWAIVYFPSRARLIKSIKKTIMINISSIGKYLTKGKNINIVLITIKNKNTDRHPKDCFKWKSSKTFFFWLLNATTIIPINKYIITALFFSVLLGVYTSQKVSIFIDVTISGVIFSSIVI